MRNGNQIELLPIDDAHLEHDWTFNGVSTRELTHCYHDYPARMIPQVASKILDKFGDRAKTLLDPYCGTGTSLVEGLIRGINVIGSDLNPTARMIAQAKTTEVDVEELDREIARIKRNINKPNKKIDIEKASEIDIRNLDFWFKQYVIEDLLFLRNQIDLVKDEGVKLFLRVVFSETVRESSNTRKTEFKLYRYAEDVLKEHKPQPFDIFIKKVERNRKGLMRFLDSLKSLNRRPTAAIYDLNTMESIPENKIAPESVDIVVTSPPYGDSRTTVAYGQYTRLSAAWLGFNDGGKVDSSLMGGTVYKEIPKFKSKKLNSAITKIKKVDEKRAKEIASFYIDLYKSIENVTKVVRKGGYTCYVVGNRRVKGVELPTDDAIKSFFEFCEFTHVYTFTRSIPNKRMPAKNSPSNVAGKLDATMSKEYIVVMKK